MVFSHGRTNDSALPSWQFQTIQPIQDLFLHSMLCMWYPIWTTGSSVRVIISLYVLSLSLSLSLPLSLSLSLFLSLSLSLLVITQKHTWEEFYLKWPLVRGDVFRPPRATISMLLSVCVGSGTQILCVTFFSLLFSCLGILSPPNRGAFMTAILVLNIILHSL